MTGKRPGPDRRAVPAEAEPLIRSLRLAHRQLVRAERKAVQLRGVRKELVEQARSLDPPVTFRALADICEMTEAGMKHLHREPSR
jgi:hypothetical protein